MAQITLETPNGPLPAYLAWPEGGGKDGGGTGVGGPWPGVVVVQDALGMSDDLRSQADRLAANGYLALAPDLYGRGGRKFSCMRSAFSQLRARSGPAFEDIEAARRQLVATPGCTGRTGVIGFCMGGGFALLAAAKYDFNAASVNYGEVPEDAADLLTGRCPVVASYGGRDKPFKKMPGRLEAALTECGLPHDVKTYPDSGHGFMNQGTGPMYAIAKVLSGTTARLGYQHDSAEDSWQRILAFFDEHVKGAGGASTTG